MSESFFGLRKRPFAALPDADCFVPLEGICQAFDALVRAASEGRGIGVLTAPAGLGKTLVCQRLARELSGNFRVALLPSGNFLTRRELLQAVLFELGHSFVRMGDQELRLTLTAALRAIRPSSCGLLLIVDEAHLLAARMLEELRALLSLGEGGEPLVRLIVVGQLALEEMLSRPQCDAFNQRIACQMMLPSLSKEESASYLARRLAWAGANVSDVFTRESLTAICEAADGVPRCLHQLADHCLTLASNRCEKPITLRTVREALEYLKQLPLTWAEPTIGRGVTSPLEAARAQAAAVAGEPISAREPIMPQANAPAQPNPGLLDETSFETYALRPACFNNENNVEPAAAESAWELDSSFATGLPWLNDEAADSEEPLAQTESSSHGAHDEIETFDVVRSAQATFDTGSPFAERPAADNQVDLEVPLPLPTQNSASEQNRPNIGPQLDPMRPMTDEEVVIDRYAALDSALHRLTRTMLNVQANARRKAAESIVPPISVSAAPIPIDALDAVHQRFDIVLPEDESACAQAPQKGVGKSIYVTAQPAAKGCAGASTELSCEPAESTAVAEAAPVASTSSEREMGMRPKTDERRPYQLLFSELRRRRRRV